MSNFFMQKNGLRFIPPLKHLKSSIKRGILEEISFNFSRLPPIKAKKKRRFPPFFTTQSGEKMAKYAPVFQEFLSFRTRKKRDFKAFPSKGIRGYR